MGILTTCICTFVSFWCNCDDNISQIMPNSAGMDSIRLLDVRGDILLLLMMMTLGLWCQL
jgi:hypothetical protein